MIRYSVIIIVSVAVAAQIVFCAVNTNDVLVSFDPWIAVPSGAFSNTSTCAATKSFFSVFSRGVGDDALVQKYTADDDEWYPKGSVTRLPGLTQSPPRCVTADADVNKIVCYVHGTNNRAYFIVYDGEKVLRGFERIAGDAIANTPEPVHRGSKRQDVLVRMSDGTIKHSWWTSSTDRYTEFGSTGDRKFLSEPSCTSSGPDFKNLMCVALGDDYDAYYNQLLDDTTGKWDTWKSLDYPKQVAARPQCVVDINNAKQPDRVDCFLRLTSENPPTSPNAIVFFKHIVWTGKAWDVQRDEPELHRESGQPYCLAWGGPSQHRIDCWSRGSDAIMYHYESTDGDKWNKVDFDAEGDDSKIDDEPECCLQPPSRIMCLARRSGAQYYKVSKQSVEKELPSTTTTTAPVATTAKTAQKSKPLVSFDRWIRKDEHNVEPKTPTCIVTAQSRIIAFRKTAELYAGQNLWEHYYNKKSGSWYGPTSFSGAGDLPPRCVTYDYDNSKYICYVPAYYFSTLHQTHYNGDKWTEWLDLGVLTNVDAMPVNRGPNRQDVLVLSPEGKIMHLWWTGVAGSATTAYSKPVTVGNKAFLFPPSCVSAGPKYAGITCVAVGKIDHKAYYTTLLDDATGKWDAWKPIGFDQLILTRPQCVVDERNAKQPERVDCFLRYVDDFDEATPTSPAYLAHVKWDGKKWDNNFVQPKFYNDSGQPNCIAWGGPSQLNIDCWSRAQNGTMHHYEAVGGGAWNAAEFDSEGDTFTIDEQPECCWDPPNKFTCLALNNQHMHYAFLKAGQQ